MFSEYKAYEQERSANKTGRPENAITTAGFLGVEEHLKYNDSYQVTTFR